MPIISTGVPAYASAGNASSANDGSYDNAWQPGTTSGWLAYDLSGVPPAARAKAVVWWETDAYGYTIAGLPGVCSGWEGGYPTAYTIDANPAPGGSLPASGWVTLQTVTGNQYKSRQALLDLSGDNWIRLDISSTANSSNNPNPDISINSFEVADAAQGVTDDWVFLGDSITAGAMDHTALTAPNGSTVLSFANMVSAETGGANHPIQDNAGLPCSRADQVSTFLNSDLLPMWPPGTYVAVTLGTNDAWGGDGIPSDYQAALNTIVRQILSAGDHPILASIPWPNTTAAWQQNVQAMNAVLGAVITANPGTLAGPDFYSFFKQQPSLIPPGNVHPTGAGYAAMRQLWAVWALNTVYGRPTPTPSPTAASPAPGSATARGTSSPISTSRSTSTARPGAVTGSSPTAGFATTLPSGGSGSPPSGAGVATQPRSPGAAASVSQNARRTGAAPGPGQTAVLATATAASAAVAVYLLLLAIGIPAVRRAAPARWVRRHSRTPPEEPPAPPGRPEI